MTLIPNSGLLMHATFFAASVLFCSLGQAQVDLVVGDGSGMVVIDVGAGQTIPLLLDSDGPISVAAGSVVVTIDALEPSEVTFNGVGSVFPGGLPLPAPPVPPQDLNIAFFANANVDGTDGLDIYGNLVLDTSSLPPGTSLTLDFTGTLLFDSNGNQVLSLPNPVSVTVGSPPLTGDFDLDGDVDADDIDFYGGNIGQPAQGSLAAIDLDGDGTITLDDHSLHVTQLVQTSNGGTGTFLGDINLDGVVDVLGDAFVLIGNLGSSSAGWAQGDLNADQLVDVLGDAFILIGNLGSGS